MMEYVPPPVPRKKLHRYETPGDARFLTCSCYRRQLLFDSAPARDAFAQQLEHVRRCFEFRLFAWVLMPNHFHLLIQPRLPESPVPKLLHALKGPLAQRLIRTGVVQCDASGDERRLWQAGGGYDRNIYGRDELFEKARYIELNPVRSGLVKFREEWAWSSAPFRKGDRSSPVAIDDLPR